MTSRPPLLLLLTSFSWQELRQHPWRTATALIAIMLGVALGFAVHVINQSALDEFSRAVRSVNGTTDSAVAAPGTIRGDLSLYKNKNLVHASDSAESAAREIAIWFPALAA